MTATTESAASATDLDEAILEVLVLVESGLSRRTLLDAVHATGKTKPKRRRLAEALLLDATVLTSGDATGPLGGQPTHRRTAGPRRHQRPTTAMRPVRQRQTGALQSRWSVRLPELRIEATLRELRSHLPRLVSRSQRSAPMPRLPTGPGHRRSGRRHLHDRDPSRPGLGTPSGTASPARHRSPQAPIAAALLET